MESYMLPLITGLMSGASSLIGDIFSSDTSAKNTQAQIQAQEQMQAQSEQFNASQAEINREFQASQVQGAEQYNSQMSNTAYQRATADMKAAGLNPMMMFGSGGPASTPSAPTASGSSASVGTPSVPMPQTKSAMGGLGQAVASGINAAVTAKTMDKMTDEIANLQTQRGVLSAETDLMKQKTETEKSETLKRSDEAALTGLSLPAARFSAKSADDLLSIPDTARRWGVVGSYFGNKASDVLAPLVSSAGAVRRWMPERTRVQTSHDGDDTFTDRWSGVGSGW